MAFEIELTHAAKVDALRYPGGEAAVLALAKQEIDELELGKLSNLFFHVLNVGEEPSFFCTPDGDHKLIVDACESETQEEPLGAGPFKGKRVVMPRGFTE